jgi:hypothetical protein
VCKYLGIHTYKTFHIYFNILPPRERERERERDRQTEAEKEHRRPASHYMFGALLPNGCSGVSSIQPTILQDIVKCLHRVIPDLGIADLMTKMKTWQKRNLSESKALQ